MWRVMYDNVCMVQMQHAGHGKSYCAFCNNGFLRHVGYVDAEFGAGWYYDCWVARRTPGAVQLLPALFAGHRFLWLQLPRGLLGPRVPRIPWTTLRIPAWNMFPNWISRRRSPTAVGVKRKCAVFFSVSEDRSCAAGMKTGRNNILRERQSFHLFSMQRTLLRFYAGELL